LRFNSPDPEKNPQHEFGNATFPVGAVQQVSQLPSGVGDRHPKRVVEQCHPNSPYDGPLMSFPFSRNILRFACRATASL
jgi:hypothetical protein